MVRLVKYLWADLRRGPFVDAPPEPHPRAQLTQIPGTKEPPARPPREFTYERRQ